MEDYACGKARQGLAWLGLAGLGKVGQGMAWNPLIT